MKKIEEIEEMTKVMDKLIVTKCGSVDCRFEDTTCNACRAEALYKAGYRKICPNAITNELGDIICGNDKRETIADFCEIDEYVEINGKLFIENQKLKEELSVLKHEIDRLKSEKTDEIKE